MSLCLRSIDWFPSAEEASPLAGRAAQGSTLARSWTFDGDDAEREAPSTSTSPARLSGLFRQTRRVGNR